MFEKTSKYEYFQCCKKGLLTKEDLVKWLKLTKKCKQLPENIWTEGVSFYFDGTGWSHKTNLVQTARARRTRLWRKRGEGLKQDCSAKGVIGCHRVPPI